MLNAIFSALTPIANIFSFILLNLALCLIAIHWAISRENNNSNPKYHRFIQTFGLIISLVIIAILWIKQWNIGDLLAFYSLFSGVMFLVATQMKDEINLKESRGWFLSIFLVFIFYYPMEISDY